MVLLWCLALALPPVQAQTPGEVRGSVVDAHGGEALANTSFTILTPGGDVIREMIGAFPSLVLAEGEYVAIARHNSNVYQTNFKVESTIDRDVEVLAK